QEARVGGCLCNRGNATEYHHEQQAKVSGWMLHVDFPSGAPACPAPWNLALFRMAGEGHLAAGIARDDHVVVLAAKADAPERQRFPAGRKHGRVRLDQSV